MLASMSFHSLLIFPGTPLHQKRHQGHSAFLCWWPGLDVGTVHQLQYSSLLTDSCFIEASSCLEILSVRAWWDLGLLVLVWAAWEFGSCSVCEIFRNGCVEAGSACAPQEPSTWQVCTAASADSCLCFRVSSSTGSQIRKRCLIAARVEVMHNSLFRNGSRTGF